MTFDIVTIFPAMIEQPLAAGVLGRAIERGHAGREGPRPARLHDRSAPGRGRRAVRRRAGDGAEARPDLPRARRDRGRARNAADGRDDVAAGAAVHAGRGAAAERPGARGAAVRALRRVRRARARARDRGDVDRRLRADRRRAAGAGDPRRGRAASCRAWSATSSRWWRIRSAAGCWIFRSSRGRRKSARLARARRAVVGQPRARFGAGGSARR